MFQPFFASWGLAEPPAVTTQPALRLWAIVLVLAGTYAYFYSDLVVRRIGVYVYFAVFTLLWAEVLLILQLGLVNQEEVIIITLALTALAANFIGYRLSAAGSRLSADNRTPIAETSLARSGPPLGLFLSTLPVLLGVVLHLRATNLELHHDWPYEISWGFVGAMAITAIACRISAYLYRHSVPWLAATYFFGTAATTMLGAAGLLALIDVQTWDRQAPLLMVIPILYMIAARAYRGHTAETPLVWAAHAATGVMIVSVLGAALHITHHMFEPVVGERLNLQLALFCALASVFYGLAAAFRKEGANIYLSTAMACGAVWQLLSYWSIDAEYYTLAFAGLGLIFLIAYRFAVLDRLSATGNRQSAESADEQTGRQPIADRPASLARAAFQCANALMSLSFVAAVLLALSRLATRETHWSLIGLLLTLTCLSLLAAGLVRHQEWRRWYFVMAIIEVLLALVALHILSQLSPWQKLEVFSIVAGLALLVGGHLGLFREHDRQSDVVSLALFAGSALVGLPLAIAVIYYRSQPAFSIPNELGMLLAGIVLLGSGFMFQLKSTTLTGAGLLAIYLVTLLMFVNMLEQIQTAAILLAVGGAAIFITGLLLSIYRDRLLTLPDRIKRREGVFRVLAWR
jgi:hypothetical protein